MPVEQLRFTNGGLTWFKAVKGHDDAFIITLVDGTEIDLNRSQAHMLKMWLEEHLK